MMQTLVKSRQAAVPTVHPELPSDACAVKRCFRENGYVVLSNAVDPEQRKAFIKEFTKQVLLQQPWRANFPFVVRDDDGEVVDIDEDTDRYVDLLTRPRLKRSVITSYKKAGPGHTGFGAPCDHGSFHNDAQNRIREDPTTYSVAASLLDNAKLWFDINRCIFKLPGEGEDEFIHLDLNPFNGYKQSAALCGKVAITKMWLLCAPGTHTEAFHARFRAAYGALYPNAKKGAKFALDPAKPDPEGIERRCVALEIPAGCVVFWDERLFHGVRKSPIDSHIQMGMYLGYMPAVDRPEYLAKAGISELEDRRRSYAHGLAITLYPSLDRVHYLPKKFLNFPRIMACYARKIPAGHPAVTSRVIGKSGRRVVHVVQTSSAGARLSTAAPYTPYPFSALGRKLLGLDSWE